MERHQAAGALAAAGFDARIHIYIYIGLKVLCSY